MSDGLFFSIIMPVYNHAAYVGEAIASVVAQTHQRWELIVVDDGSTDGSAGVIDGWMAKDARIRAIHQKNAGPSAARNRGIAEARGEWLAYLDSDDVWYPAALARYAEYFAAHPEVSFVHGRRDRLNPDGSITPSAGEYQERDSGPVELFGRMYLSHLCVCYRKDLAERIGGYDETLRTAEDYDLYLRMTPFTRFWPLGKATGLRRRHETNVSRQTGKSRQTEARVLEKFLEQGGKGLIPRRLASRRLARVYESAGRLYGRAGDKARAKECLHKSLGYRFSLRAAWGMMGLWGSGRVMQRSAEVMQDDAK